MTAHSMQIAAHSIYRKGKGERERDPECKAAPQRGQHIDSNESQSVPSEILKCNIKQSDHYDEISSRAFDSRPGNLNTIIGTDWRIVASNRKQIGTTCVWVWVNPPAGLVINVYNQYNGNTVEPPRKDNPAGNI